MRTTLRIDDAIFREYKIMAAKSHRTLAAVIEEVLQERLTRREPALKPRSIKLPVSTTMGGLRPGLNIDKTSALLDLDLEEDKRKLGLT